MTGKEIPLDRDDAELAGLLGAEIEDIRLYKAGFSFVGDVAQRIREARLARGWTQKRLADRLGVTVGRVSQYETGDLRHAPSLRTLAEIAYALGMEIGLFLVSKAEAWSPQTAEADLSVGEAAVMDFEVLADRLQSVAAEVVRRHPEMEPNPLLSEQVRGVMQENEGQ